MSIYLLTLPTAFSVLRRHDYSDNNNDIIYVFMKVLGSLLSRLSPLPLYYKKLDVKCARC
jgi:hypothetical protein